MALISRLGVVLGLDSAEFNAGLGKAESALTKMGIKSVAIGNVVQDLAYKIAGAVPAALKLAAEIDDLAKANEVAVSTVLNLSKALQLSGGESANAGKLLASFTNKVDEAATGTKKAQESFADVGVTLKDLATLTGQQLFEKTIAGLAKIEDPVRRNALAMELLGKAVRGVDIGGFADTLINNSTDFSKSEKAFNDIGQAMDRLDEFTQRASTSLATMFAPALKTSVSFLDEFVFGWNKLEDAIRRTNKAQRENSEWQPTATIGDKPKGGMFNLPAEYSADANVRSVTDAKGEEARKKAASDAESLKKKIESQTDALSQQIRQYQLQTAEIGEQKSEYQKMLLEFEKGGRFADVRNEKLKEAALLNAKALDDAKNQAEINKINYQLEVQRAIELGNLYEQGRQITEDIKERKYLQDEAVNAQLIELENQRQRLEYEQQMAGLADTQVQKALKLFDLSKEALALYREGELTEQQIAKLIEAKSAVIMAEEENTRAQNTFQAGWDRAFNNFMERAKDSSVIGAETFTNMTSSMTSALERFVETGKLSFSDLIRSMIQDLIKFMIKAQAAKVFGFIGDALGFGFGGGADLSPSASYGGIIGMKATGGDVYGNTPYIVGERGAELFVPKNSGTIIPNNQLSSALSSQPQNVYNAPVIQNMSAIDTQSALQFLQRNKEGVWAATQSAQRSMPMQRGS